MSTNKNDLKKTLVCSSSETKKLIEEFVSKEAKERNTTQSVVLEEYILAGIARNFPEKKDEIQEIFKRRYQKYVAMPVLTGEEA